jgi:hypothetical protein
LADGEKHGYSIMTANPFPARCLFSLFGIPVTWTARSWRFFPPKFAIGVVVALLALPDQPVLFRLMWGIGYGLLLFGVLFLHIIGHMISSRLVAPPMTEARIEQTLIETRYDSDPSDLPPRVHLVRSLGGPTINLLLGSLALLLGYSVDHHALRFFAGANLAICALVLLPFPSVDGSVIWRELPRLFRR